MANLRRHSRLKPWLAKKKGRNVRTSDGELIKPFQGKSSASSAFYKTEQWRATRKHVLDRDGICQWCLHLARVTPATEADHIVPLARCVDSGIDPYDPTNIVGSCRSCNASRASYEAKGVDIPTFDGWVEFMRKKFIDKMKK